MKYPKLKSFGLLTLLFVLLCVFILPVLAQTAAPPPGVAEAPVAAAPATPPWAELLTMIVVPVMIAGLKWAAPKVPGGILPYLAPALGMVVDYGLQWAGMHGNTLLGGILGGSAGVGLREAVKQFTKPAPQDPTATPAPPLALLLALCGLSIGIAGCGTLDPAGPYAGDKVAYSAEFTIVQSYNGLHEFVLYEKAHRAELAKWPEIKQAADYVRLNARKWNDSAVACLEAYKASPTPDNRSALDKALSILQTGLAEASKYLVPQPPQ